MTRAFRLSLIRLLLWTATTRTDAVPTVAATVPDDTDDRDSAVAA